MSTFPISLHNYGIINNLDVFDRDLELDSVSVMLSLPARGGLLSCRLELGGVPGGFLGGLEVVWTWRRSGGIAYAPGGIE